MWLALISGVEIAPNQYAPTRYELRSNGMTGPLLATGQLARGGVAQMELRHDPVAGTVGAIINGTSIGAFPARFTPCCVGFEGVGYLNNFTVRRTP